MDLLRKCSDLSKPPKGTVDDFFALFKIVDVFGSGADGVVFKVIHDDQMVAVKLTYYFGEIPDEIVIACATDQLSVHTSSLASIIAYGVFEHELIKVLRAIDSNIDEHMSFPFNRYEDVQFIEHTYIKTDVLVVVMPFYVSYDEVFSNASNDAQKEALFELLIAIYTLNSVGIFHRDVGPHNIIMTKVDFKRIYRVDGIDFVIESEYMPILIDYGWSEFSERPEYLGSLKRSFGFYRVMSLDDLRLTESQDQGSLGQLILSETFDTLKNKQIEAGDTVRIFSDLDIS